MPSSRRACRAPLVEPHFPLCHSSISPDRPTPSKQRFPYKLSIRRSNNLVPRCTMRSVLSLSDHRLLRETLLDRSTTLHSNAQGSSFCAISRNDGHILQRQGSCYYLSTSCLNSAGMFHSQKRIHWSSCQRIAKYLFLVLSPLSNPKLAADISS